MIELILRLLLNRIGWQSDSDSFMTYCTLDFVELRVVALPDNVKLDDLLCLLLLLVVLMDVLTLLLLAIGLVLE
jgi:hypothetical protein